MNGAPNIHLEALIHPLTPVASLRVVCCGLLDLGARCCEHLAPHVTGEDAIMVRHGRLWYPVHLNHQIPESSSNLWRRESVLERNKMRCLGEAVDHDRVEAVGLGQTFDEVHSEVSPWPFRHWWGLEEAYWFGVLELSMLAHRAPTNKIVRTQSPRHHLPYYLAAPDVAWRRGRLVYAAVPAVQQRCRLLLPGVLFGCCGCTREGGH